MKNTLTLIFLLFLLPVADAQFHSDCSSAKPLCSNATVTFDAFHGRGAVRNEVGSTDCYSGLFPENNGMWLRWTIGTPGELAFTLTPKQDGDDLDFVIFRVLDGSNDCSLKEPVRCAVSGENQGQSRSTYSACMGATGLRASATDFAERRGCYGADDNFVASIVAQEGESYLLYVNNYASKVGFTLEFTGDADFTPISEEIIALSTNEPIMVGQEVEVHTPESKKAYFWEFGEDATPVFASSQTAQTVSFSRPGMHEIKRYDLKNSCAIMTTKSVMVYERVQPEVAATTTRVSDIQVGQAFPNPSSDKAYINITTPVSRTAIILIADVLGRQISRTEVELVAGEQQLPLDLGRLQQTQNLFVNVQIGDEQFQRRLLYLRP